MLKGTARKDRVNKNEPKPKADLITKPDYLSPPAGKYWDRVYPDLFEAKIITNLDRDSLAMLCESYALWRIAKDEVSKHGSVMGAWLDHPYLMVMQISFQQLKTMLAEFGMTPSSRTKIAIVGSESPELDGWDSFWQLQVKI